MKLVAAVFAVLLLTGCSSGLNFSPTASGPDASCANLFIKAVVTDKATGVYDCFSYDAQVAYFDSHGWTSDKDIQAYIDADLNTAAAPLAYRALKLNPTPDCINQTSNGCTLKGYAYHYWIAPIVNGQPDWVLGGNINIVLDPNGKIESVG